MVVAIDADGVGWLGAASDGSTGPNVTDRLAERLVTFDPGAVRGVVRI